MRHSGLTSILELAFLFILISLKDTSATISTEKEALLAFKSHISTESPTFSSWDPSSSPCNWTGVVCNKYGDQVVKLDLSGQDLTGPISPAIANLSYLQSLQLQSNRFTGTLPTHIGNLFRLQVLNISFNSVEGLIPPNISWCKELRVLDLKGNEFWGEIPQEIGHLSKLQVLNLAQNNFSGSIPPSLANISTLVTINFGTNAIGGTIPSDLGRLYNLKHLDLVINRLTGTIPSSIYNMSSLVYLAVASNQLSGTIPQDVGDTLPNLLGFNFCFNKFTGMIPGSLHNLTRIQIIRMASNLLHGTVPPGLGNLPDLRMYNIGKNRIVSSGKDGLSFITALANSTWLNFLAIDDNLLEGVIPESIGNLSRVLNLLYMGENRIYGSIPATIGNLRGLNLLNLSYNSLSGKIPVSISQLEELQVLSLAGNRVSDRIPDVLGNLLNLNEIDLSANNLEGTIPTTFGNFAKLLSMDLSSNRLNGSIPGQVLSLPSLSNLLNLSNNLLVGQLPQEIGNLQKVATIDVSDNGLSGNIPNAIGKCASLQELLMAGNLLDGEIPSALGDLKGLEALDLSANQLSGHIPVNLQNLQALQLLNLSYNNLEGEIPNSGFFSNASKVYLQGNPRLCTSSACKSSEGGGNKKILVFIGVPVLIITSCLICGISYHLRKNRTRFIPSSPSYSLGKQHQMVSYGELRGATGDFDEDNLIGGGSFGTVYKGILRDGTAIAVKVLDIGRVGAWKSFSAECKALRNVRHRNLVKLITSCSSMDCKNREFLALVYEFMSNGSLDEWLRGKKRHPNGQVLNVLERLNLLIDVGSAMSYLHDECETPVVHCDLKPSNILFDVDMTAKVADFGLATLLVGETNGQTSTSFTHCLKGSVGYIPPEYGSGMKPTRAGDVYSYGVMLLQLLTGRSPTHESFTEGLSLTRWVESAFPTRTLQVLDSELLKMIGNLHHEGRKINEDAETECLVTIVGVGLSCTNTVPSGRLAMIDVVHKLKLARDALLKPMSPKIRNHFHN